MKNAGDMTSRERIDAVMRGEVPDRVPVFTAGHGITRHMLGVSYGEMVQSPRLMSSCMLAWQDLIGDDRLMAYFDMMVEAAGFGQPMVFQDDQPAYSDKDDLLIKSPDDYLKLERYDVEKAERIRMTLEVADILYTTRGDTVPVAAIVAEPLVVLGLLRGMEPLLMDCIRHPEAVRQALEVVTDVVIDYARALVKRGVSLVVNCHDYGNRSIMSEKLWMSLQADCLRRMNAAIRETGATLIIHNCDAAPYIDAAFDDIGGVDVYQCAALPAIVRRLVRVQAEVRLASRPVRRVVAARPGLGRLRRRQAAQQGDDRGPRRRRRVHPRPHMRVPVSRPHHQRQSSGGCRQGVRHLLRNSGRAPRKAGQR